MKIVVAGGCGFVGSNISIFLKKKFNKAEVISVDNLSRKGSEINQRRLKKHGILNFKKDISKKNSLNFLKNKIEFFIDCCANPAIEESKKNLEEIIKSNFLTTKNILEFCKKNKSKLIFFSTSRVYSIKKLNDIIKKKIIKKPLKIKKLINENFSTNGIKSIYGLTKYFSEELIKEFTYLHKIKYIINRCGIISGVWQLGKQEQGVLSFFMKNHVDKKEISLIGYGGCGHQIRDVLDIDDLNKLIYLQINKFNKYNNITFNVGGGPKNAISILNLKKLCEKISKFVCKTNIINQTSNYDIPYYVTDNSKVTKIYKWTPKISVYKTLFKIYKWQINNKKLLKKF